MKTSTVAAMEARVRTLCQRIHSERGPEIPQRLVRNNFCELLIQRHIASHGQTCSSIHLESLFSM